MNDSFSITVLMVDRRGSGPQLQLIEGTRSAGGNLAFTSTFVRNSLDSPPWLRDSASSSPSLTSVKH